MLLYDITHGTHGGATFSILGRIVWNATEAARRAGCAFASFSILGRIVWNATDD